MSVTGIAGGLDQFAGSIGSEPAIVIGNHAAHRSTSVPAASIVSVRGVSRIYGHGLVHPLGTSEFDALAVEFPELPGRRSVIEVEGERVTTSCGYAVPLMDLVGDRDRLVEWAEKKGEAGIVDYWATKNALSVDGLAGIES